MPVVAMITRITIKRRKSFANGYEFPITGAYEKLVGKIYGEVHPKNRFNKAIVNLARAPGNKRGKVEYWSDFCILKPVDMVRGNGKIFYDAPNRGSKRIVSFLTTPRRPTIPLLSKTPATASSCAKAIPLFGVDGRAI